MQNIDSRLEWFADSRYGMFIHFGLYSLLGRGEWVMNREQTTPEEFEKLAMEFNPVKFDADKICQLAVDGGMKYVVFTTMHHEGFRLYDSDLTDFCSTKTASKRDFTAEMIEAAKKHGLKIGLYHSLNNWHDSPDGVAALENENDYELFIENTHARIRELLEKYNPIDILWYDGWWPFNAKGWKAEEMNKMVFSIQPHIIVNGRNGLAGDFGTPEGHISAPSPWRPWEACMTLNNHWGYHISDTSWKSPLEVIDMLHKVAIGKGNLLLNIGPRGDGSIPEESEKIVRKAGEWLKTNGKAIYESDIFDYDLREKGNGRGDWDHNGVFTAQGKSLYFIMKYYPGKKYILTGMETCVKKVSLLSTQEELSFEQSAGKVTVALPEKLANEFCPVLEFQCDEAPAIYRTGGMRTPQAPHPHYDPCESDIAH
jgi:alpha-L-fucosidase